MTDNNTPSLATRAVQALVKNSVVELKQGQSQQADALLYLGNWHDALPRVLIQDPVLEPTDKIIWQVIKLETRERGSTAFPNYQRIGQLANIKAKATIARAIAILRASRWLTLCERVRDEKTGQWRGNVYALHDEPLTLAETMELDSDYRQFLYHGIEHKHPRVRQVAQAVLETIDTDIEQGIDLEQPVSALERRAAALEALQQQSADDTDHEHQTPLEEQHYFAFNLKAMRGLQTIRLVKSKPDERAAHDDPSLVDKSQVQKVNSAKLSTDDDRVQKMNSVNPGNDQVQILNPVQPTGDLSLELPGLGQKPAESGDSDKILNSVPVVVSSSKLTTTGEKHFSSHDLSSSQPNTTATNNSQPVQQNKSQNWRQQPLNPALHFPEYLSKNRCLLIQMYIGRHGFDLDSQQDILDELAGVHHSHKQHGTRPITNPVAWVNKMCTLMKDGGFNLSLGLDMRERRERQANETQQAELWRQGTGIHNQPDLPPPNPNDRITQRVLAIQNKKRDQGS